jgi:hypothetical protein
MKGRGTLFSGSLSSASRGKKTVGRPRRSYYGRAPEHQITPPPIFGFPRKSSERRMSQGYRQ